MPFRPENRVWGIPSKPCGINEEIQRPWTVKQPCPGAGKTALNDTAYQQASLRMMKTEKTFLRNISRDSLLIMSLSSANYYLIRIGDAKNIISSLGKKGILVRTARISMGSTIPTSGCGEIKKRKRNFGEGAFNAMPGIVIAGPIAAAKDYGCAGPCSRR